MKKIFIFVFVFVSVLSNSQVIYNVSLGDVQLSNSDIDSNYLVISSNDLACTNVQTSHPSLPSKYFNIIIPDNTIIVSVEIINYTIDSFFLTKPILPFQGDLPIGADYWTQNFISPSDTIYNSNTAYPENLITDQTLNYFDESYPIVTLNIIPFKYYPASNILLFYSSFDIKINLRNNKTITYKPKKYLGRSAENQQKYNKILYSIVDNTQDIILENVITDNKNYYVPKEYTYEYVIITSAELAPAFNKFLMWKRRKGIDIGIVTMEYINSHYSGDTVSGIYDDAGKVRQFLIDSYNRFGKKLTYVLLGGDKNVVPIRIGRFSDDIPTDLYFSDLTGNWDANSNGIYGEPFSAINKLGSVFTGRLLCSTKEHIENWTEKIIKYESNPGNGNFDYLTKAFITKADQLQCFSDSSPFADLYAFLSTTFALMEYKEKSNGQENCNSNETPDFPTGEDVITEFNNNYGFASFLAHGGPSKVAVGTKGYNIDNYYSKREVISIEGIYHGYFGIVESGNGFTNMTNINFPTIFYSLSCETMPFDNDSIINMAQSYTCISNGGGPAYLGNSRNGRLSSSPKAFLTFGRQVFHFEICNLGIAEAISRRSSYDNYIILSHNLIGCPETEMWTGIPNYFSNVTVTQNGTSVTVNTGGITGCKIAIMSMDYGQTDFKAFVDITNSLTSYTFNNIQSSNYYVTITKHDYIPYIYPQDIFIQNDTISNNSYVAGRNIYVGKEVTSLKPQGNVVINNNANVIFDARKEVFLKKGFECTLGSKIEVLEKK